MTQKTFLFLRILSLGPSDDDVSHYTLRLEIYGAIPYLVIIKHTIVINLSLYEVRKQTRNGERVFQINFLKQMFQKEKIQEQNYIPI